MMDCNAVPSLIPQIIMSAPDFRETYVMAHTGTNCASLSV